MSSLKIRLKGREKTLLKGEDESEEELREREPALAPAGLPEEHEVGRARQDELHGGRAHGAQQGDDHAERAHSEGRADGASHLVRGEGEGEGDQP